MVNTFSWPPALWGSASPRRRCRRWASAPPGRTPSPGSAKQPDGHKASLSQSSASYSWLKLTCSSGRSAITVATPLLLPCMALLAPLSRQAVDLGSMLAISLPFGKPWVFVFVSCYAFLENTNMYLYRGQSCGKLQPRWPPLSGGRDWLVR